MNSSAFWQFNIFQMNTQHFYTNHLEVCLSALLQIIKSFIMLIMKWVNFACDQIRNKYLLWLFIPRNRKYHIFTWRKSGALASQHLHFFSVAIIGNISELSLWQGSLIYCKLQWSAFSLNGEHWFSVYGFKPNYSVVFLFCFSVFVFVRQTSLC